MLSTANTNICNFIAVSKYYQSFSFPVSQLIDFRWYGAASSSKCVWKMTRAFLCCQRRHVVDVHHDGTGYSVILVQSSWQETTAKRRKYETYFTHHLRPASFLFTRLKYRDAENSKLSPFLLSARIPHAFRWMIPWGSIVTVAIKPSHLKRVTFQVKQQKKYVYRKEKWFVLEFGSEIT